MCMAAPSVPRPLALILGDSRFGIGQAGEPPRLHLPHVVCHGLGFVHLCSGIALGLLLRQLTRMHYHEAQFLLGDAPIAIFDLHVPHDTLPVPAARRFRLRPSRFLHEQGQGGLLLSPGFEFLAHGTGARDEGDY